MKLCIISDIHCARPYFAEIIKKHKDNVDLFVICGDLTDHNIDPDPFLKYLPKNKFLFIPGNCDPLNKLQKYKNNNIDKKIVEIRGYKFCGLGGALRTEFNKSFVDQNLWDENEAKEILKKFPEKCILVTHSPPKFLLDKTIFGKNDGSIEILRFIKHKKPKFVFCGHIHEQRGILNFRDTIIINPGYYGMFYTIVEIKNKKIEIKTFKNEVDPIASCTF